MALVLCLVPGARATAQEKQPFWMRWPDGRLRLAFEYEGERWSRTGMEELKEDEYTFTEELKLRTDGYVYHPRLLRFDAAGLVALEQVLLDSNATAREVDTDALDTGHDVRATLLDEKPVTFDFFSQRENREVRQSFFGVTEITDTHLGGDAFVKHSLLPSQLHFDHATTKGEGLDKTDQALDTLFVESSNRHGGSDTRLRYEFTDLELRRTRQEFQIHDVLLTNLFRFGADDEHRSTTTARFRDQAGVADNQLSSLRNNTVLAHTPRLSTHYDAAVDLNRAESVEVRTGAAGLGLTHTLYRNLTSSLAARASRSEIDGGSVDSYGGRADWLYRRGLPFGSLQLGYGVDYSIQSEEDLGDEIPVVGEPHTFQVGVPLLLDQRFPNPSTVVIRSASGPLIVYEEGLDYVLVATGPLLRVEVSIGSRISDGQALLIDYRQRTVPDRDFSRFLQQASAQLAFGSLLSFYANWSREDVDLLSGSTEETLGSSERRGAGAQLYWGPSTTSVDYEQSISPFVPYERAAVREILTQELRRDVSGSLRGSYARTFYTDEGELEETAEGAAGLRAYIGSDLSIEAEGGYRWGHFRTEDAQGFFASLAAIWRYRAYELRLSARHVDNSFRVANDYREDRILFEIRREF